MIDLIANTIGALGALPSSAFWRTIDELPLTIIVVASA